LGVDNFFGRVGEFRYIISSFNDEILYLAEFQWN